MNSKRFLLGVSLVLALVFGAAIYLFRARYCRSVTLRNLSNGEVQSVSVDFLPYHVRWTISGEVKGTGIVVVSYVYSNEVSGTFSASGKGDYYDTNASIAFIPKGETSGKIRGSFMFHNW